MEQQKFVTPLKVGLLVVATAYFLFTLHQTFMLTWIGEWEVIQDPTTRFWIFLTDTTAGVFLVFRFIASLIAFSTMVLYFVKKGLPQTTVNKLLRVIVVLEGLYWIGLLMSGIWGVLPTSFGFNISLVITTGIPCLVASIGIPIALFTLAFKLNPKKPQREAIKWGLIAGVLYVVAFWLNNSGVWINEVLWKGFGSLITYPEMLVSFVASVFGLLALAIFTGYFAKKSIGTERVQDLKLRTVGAIFVALGMYFLWNYLTWIFFGGWNGWYAWILGHNLDLWLLSLPLVGLPLLFHDESERLIE